MLTIVGWGILLGIQVGILLPVPFEVEQFLWSWGYPMSEFCVLLGILRIASSDTNFENARSSSMRYKPLDLYATGDR